MTANSKLRGPDEAPLVDILVCPRCKGQFAYIESGSELICKACRLSYPVKNDIPVMLEGEARKLPQEE